MEKNKELQEHIKTIGEWASQDGKRVAFVVCGEITEDGVETSNALVGRTDRIASALFGSAMENEAFKLIIGLAAKTIENPLLATLLAMKASKDESPESESRSDKGVADAFKDLLGAIADKIRKDD